MRIVHVLGALVAGGAERVVSELLPAILQAGHQPSLLLLSPRRDHAGETMSRDLEGAGVPFLAGPTVRVGFRSVLWLARTLRAVRPEIVHLHNLNAEMAYLLARPLLGFPHRTVRTIHNTELAAPLLARLGFAWNPVGATVFCGQASSARNRGRFSGDTVVIPNGVCFGWEPQNEPVRETARRRLGWKPGEVHFLCVGRMDGSDTGSAQKAHDVLIRAWQGCRAKEQGGWLHLLGAGELRPALERIASGDPSIHFAGVRADARGWMQAADAFLMPSRWEGLPIAALEAVGTGLRCVFSRIEPLRELGAPSASWCEPDDVASLTRALDEVLTQPRPTPEETQTFRDRYDIETAAQRHLALYRRVLAGGSGSEPTLPSR